ncbi:polysaccharide deacetylase family protein [Paenibacillus roseipurpureus]|uniref:Polysaccharide deacetylase family protein n=1 Tax=Paenibacillus roseopurpureus TaxID=2918901 RepID=A0AA96LJ76_9BACL|nr:polysaccharide deacetylase family protein [Paenibacillus sp. MBLB1832]WNR42057.1 polysaccharide deacetylase family protein [Paenibacillus sp. MBLB1832]
MYKSFFQWKTLTVSILAVTIWSCQPPLMRTASASHPVIEASNGNKHAYLTFDDGPSENTDRILDILHEYRVHATFFVVGNSSFEGKRLYRRIHEEGHAIGNHTYSHEYPSLYASVQAFLRDTERLERLLEQTIGIRPTLLRYPGGSNNLVSRHFGGRGIMPRIIQEMGREGYAYTDWNVSSTDAARIVQPKNEIIDAVLSASRTKKEAIILMHDVKVKTTTVDALPAVIEGLRKQGFNFGVLSKDSYQFHF